MVGDAPGEIKWGGAGGRPGLAYIDGDGSQRLTYRGEILMTQDPSSGEKASFTFGLIWGLWHVPAFLLGGTKQGAWSFTPLFSR